MKRCKRLRILLPAVTVFLELLPFGAVLNFANPDGEAFRRTFSYFDLTPFGYANFAPLITAIFTCIIFILSLISLVKEGQMLTKTVKVISLVAFFVSLAPLSYDISAFSVVGAMISILLLSNSWLNFYLDKHY
ncbi:MAG: hypothetical protein IKD04_01970 [Clostridia bacterium]|nr:hypothetical protein [Clostridia bacterium]